MVSNGMGLQRKQEGIEIAMKNSTNNKPRQYMFFYRNYDEPDIIFAKSFKEAVYELYKNEDNSTVLNNSFEKALRELDDNDIDGIILLHSRLSSYYQITKVYVIEEKIYDYYEEE